MSNNYIYLFIRRDLSIAQQIIQTAHAAHLIGMSDAATEEVPNAVLFGVENLEELHAAAEYLKKYNIVH